MNFYQYTISLIFLVSINSLFSSDGKFNLIEAHHDGFGSNVTISSLQISKDNYDAVFQVHSASGLSENLEKELDQTKLNYPQEINKVYISVPHRKNISEQEAKDFLDKTYETILKTTMLKGKRKVFLRPIFIGFMDEMDWIVKAIVKNKQFIIDSGLDVNLLIYDEEFSVFSTAKQSLQDLVYETGGQYIKYSPNQLLI